MAFSERSALLGAALGIAGVLLWQYEADRRHPERHEITMTARTFSNAPAFVTVEGTISGQGVGYPNNSVTIQCGQEDKFCRVGSVQQIGDNQIGSVDVVEYPITKWNDDEIVAEDLLSDFGCSHTTINIERKREAVEWVQSPVNLTKAMCAKADTKLYRWTIETSRFWQRMNKDLKRQ